MTRRARDKLVTDNMVLVEQGLRSIRAVMWGPQFEAADLRGAGFIMLVKKASRFDPKRGHTFEAFARKAIKGAMWELIRRKNWREASHLQLVPELVEIADDRQGPVAMLEFSRIHNLAEEAIQNALTAREERLVRRYYSGEDLGRIARDWGISQSGASKIHVGALKKMREYFRLRGRTAA